MVHGHLARDPDVQIFHFKQRGECGFLIWRGDRAEQAIQVCYDPAERLPAREVTGLLEAMTATGLQEGLILTHGTDDIAHYPGGRTIRMQPLWHWLC